MHRLAPTVLTLALALGPAAALAQNPQPAPAPTPPPTGEEAEKTVYAVGLMLWRNLERLDLTPAELEIVKRALSDAAAGKAEVKIEDYLPRVDALARDRMTKRTEAEKAKSKAYLERAAAEPGAVKTESGLVYFEQKAGSGESPTATDTVKVHYTGTLVDGTEFDSSRSRGEPAEFPLGGVIKCWTEGLQRMKPGGVAKLVCPSDIAYGDRGRPKIPGGAALIFEVELLEVKPKAAPAPAPTPAPTSNEKSE
jgi:FKBP-type peptidyl-prolyl cis-trans isomerase FkpA